MTCDSNKITSLSPSSQSDIITRKIIGYGTRKGKLYFLDLATSGETRISQAFKTSGDSTEKNQNFIWLWHRRHRVSFPLSMNKSTVPFAIVHSDVWGPAPISTSSGARWFVTFIDDCTRMTWISLLKTKGEVCTTFQQFYKMVDTQFHAKIKILRSDNGGEFVNHDLCQFLEAHGIEHQRTCPYTPQQNGVAERKNRHLLEVVRASLFDAQMPRSFWGEAVCSAAYLINRVPSSVLNFQTPLQALRQFCALHSTPNLEPRVFGCVTFVHLYTHQRNKLEPRALKCVFIGYAQHQKGYRCYHPPTQKLYITMDVVFREEEMYFSGGVQAQASPDTVDISSTWKDSLLWSRYVIRQFRMH
ncbi:hypothetical protein Prudu_550S000600, partial [Prunus dulcis]